MNPTCRVQNCRYSSFHVTSRHSCGKCHQYGHGIMECDNNDLIEGLKIYYNDVIINDMCNVLDCDERNTHVTSGHSCRYCNKVSKHLKNCPVNGTEICDNYDQTNTIDSVQKDYIDMILKEKNLQKGDYILLYAGMGCTWYIRSNIITGTIEYMFMHSDSWGQYGEDTSDVPRLNAFIYKYSCIYNDIK